MGPEDYLQDGYQAAQQGPPADPIWWLWLVVSLFFIALVVWLLGGVELGKRWGTWLFERSFGQGEEAHVEDRYRLARHGNIVLGVWLFLSAFVWRHTEPQMTNTWICGGLVTLFALVSLRVPRVRYMNALVAIWLFISAWALPTYHPGTAWHNGIVAILIFALALVPSYARAGTSAPGTTPPTVPPI